MGGVDRFADFPRPEMPFEAVAIFTSQSTQTDHFLQGILLAEVGQPIRCCFLFFLIAFFSEIVGTVAGFGSSVFFVPLAGLFFDFHTVLALTSILHVFSNAANSFFSDDTCGGDCSCCSGSRVLAA